MKKEFKELPYRKNVCLVTFREKKFLLINLSNWPDDWWKFPQGGIEDGENLMEAGIREFREEIGTNKFKIIGSSRYTNDYNWPDDVIEVKGKRWRGQTQQFLVIEFQGKDKDIKLNNSEVRQYKWVNKKEILNFSQNKEHMLFQNYNGIIPWILKEYKDFL